MVVERHRSIAPVTNHVDVSHFVVEWDAVDRQMTFSKAAMSLLIKRSVGYFRVADKTPRPSIQGDMSSSDRGVAS